ncbi:conjugal transfer transcriptional regulator TraJ [Sedimenticola hydrogenitrophicus]|uniref:conjugal transfer transcriptional regulator TraJ n=1 Tax=Sedimenticola hydrogenitrophicus TaxID=2967975 RepID=UPI0021A2613A|nr:conjugal transfer transcriptional regulator TraJ [Sedimenticola hydrogenitrophicus]
MEQDQQQQDRKRRQHLRVPVFPDEKETIERQAKQSGLSVARYLREVGQGYQIKGIVDYEQVRELARINGDLGRLGGLLKLWLTNDERTAHFGGSTIQALLGRIEATQDEMGKIMMSVVMPRAEQ